MFVFVGAIPFCFIGLELIGSGRKYENPIKRNIISVQLTLEKIIKSSYKNTNSESQEFIVQKEIMDIYSVADYYNDAIKELKKAFGSVLNFDKINYSKSNNQESLDEILDQLTLSIPYYIFYGRIDQMKELDMHLKNIVNYLDVGYSIAGHQFINEIIEMNTKIIASACKF